METSSNSQSPPPAERDTCHKCGTDWKPGGEVKRRTFLGGAIAVIYGAITAAVVAPALGFVGAPLLKKKEDGHWLAVADLDELADGETKSVNYTVRVKDGYMEAKRSYSLYLHRKGNEVMGFDPSCPHLGCRVDFKASKDRYICPCHGGVFSNTGELVSGPPPHGLNKLTTKVEDGRIWLYRV